MYWLYPATTFSSQLYLKTSLLRQLIMRHSSTASHYPHGTDSETSSSGHESTWNQLQDDLKNKVVHGDERIFRRLKLDQVDGQFLSACLASFFKDNDETIKDLQATESFAFRRLQEEYDYSQDADFVQDSGVRRGLVRLPYSLDLRF